MPEIVQDIGAYAGLASILGLAVLSVLYFSQARDVKRLREWAGRAPERAADAAPVPGRVTTPGQAQPAAPVATAPAPGASVAKPGPPGVPAPAVGAGKAPGVPAPAGGAGNPAGPPGVPTPAPGAAKAPAGPPVRPGAPVPAGATAAAGTAAATAAAQNRQASSNAGAGAQALAARPAVPATAAGPATPAGGRPPGAPPVPPTPRPIGQPTAIIPPERPEPWYRRLLASPLYIVLTVAGVLVLGGAAVFAVSEISGDDGGTTSERRTQAGAGVGAGDEPADDGDQGGSRPRRPPVDPSSVTVAVLNGTTVPGLAAGVADEVKSFGFQIGTVANAPDQDSQRGESVVLFAPGHRQEAQAVSRRLDIPQRERVDPENQGLAGDAGVVVVAGGDRANQ